jgi:hypothetical protein
MSVTRPYLEVTYRKGRPLAAYYSLPRRPGQKVHRSRAVEAGLVVDLDREGEPLGIEITAPTVVTLAAMNRVLRGLGLPTLTRAEFEPLRAAS